MIPISDLLRLLDSVIDSDYLRQDPTRIRADWFGTFYLSSDDHQSFATVARIAAGEGYEPVTTPATPGLVEIAAPLAASDCQSYIGEGVTIEREPGGIDIILDDEECTILRVTDAEARHIIAGLAAVIQ